jgi:SAM-dependent methyltransferase
VEDAATWILPEASYDCVASIATLHHLPFEPLLERMARALRPGGVLLVLDLVQPEGLTGALLELLALPVHLLLHRFHTGAFRDPLEVRRAWREHGETDTYLRLAQVRVACARLLPGAEVRRHLLWRYSIVWQKPFAAGDAA